jgi:ring-1,2-phenylacetyl-CoA epoxidase subunit PaaC
LQRALDALVPLAPMLFEMVENQQTLADSGLYPGCGSTCFGQWHEELARVAADASLRLPALLPPSDQFRGGRHGVHTPHLKALLDEMCEVYRIEPGAAW